MFEHDSSSYLALIRRLQEARHYSEIRTTIQDMLNNEFAIFSTPELSDLMKLLGRAKMVIEALSVLYVMKHRACKPDTSTYNSVNADATRTARESP